jgi:hypothetical protein
MVVQAALPGAVQAVAAGLADGFATAFVLVVGSDVPDRFVQANRIVFRPHPCYFGFEQGGVGDGNGTTRRVVAAARLLDRIASRRLM